ncbi:hypothetical protein SCCGRSA3_00235 [Marine Group I thaumarchaeote SCGC RSA3]|uniref:Uncharacterized protein n=2 Tax=Marine Group I TaxID=905826 RepID=A0A081RQG8_9ARCH|nr:hypothetical protein AAA799N04_00133 [Marine Group I thaumarchaeote SCGC AAA799-N04]KFM20421.1 hypothetical protein SCCGRSA3_00235 [Marine Group I thaumarchaeote SCGC RSA3]
MPEEKPENKDSFLNKVFRFIVKDTGFDPDSDK